jgi:hypothetical protein
MILRQLHIPLAAVFAIAQVATAQLSLEPSPTPNENVKRLRWLDRADAVADFRRHVRRRRDTRFIAIYGFATIVPGTDEARHSKLIHRHGVRYIEGTSDTPSSTEEVRLNDKAEAYAEQYNAMLLKYLTDHRNT